MKKLVDVTMTVEVEVDESKFTEEFMAEFRSHFYKFDGVDDHIKHLAQLCAREIYDLMSSIRPQEFIEGYGPAGDFGIECRVRHTEMEIVV